MKSGLILVSIIIVLISTTLHSQTPKLKWINGGISRDINQFLISPYGKNIGLIDGIDGAYFLKIFNINNKKMTNDFIFPYGAQIIDFSNDNNSIFINTTNIIKLNLETGEAISLEKQNYQWSSPLITSYALSTTSDTLILIYFGQTCQYAKDFYCLYSWGIYFYDFKNKTVKKFLDTSFQTNNHYYDNSIKQNRSVAISPAGNRVAIANDSGYINLYDLSDLNNFKLIEQFKTTTNVTLSLLFTADGSKIISSCPDGSVNIWDINSIKLEKILHSKSCNTYLINKQIKDNKIVIKYANRDTNIIDNFYIYNLQNESFIDSFNIDKSKYNNYSIDDSLINMVYNIANYKHNYQLLFKKIKDSTSIQITPDSIIRPIIFGESSKNWIISHKRDSIIYLQNKINGQIEKTINCKISPIWFLKVSPDRNKLIVFSGTIFQIWDLINDTLFCQIDVPKRNTNWWGITPFCFSANSESFWVSVNSINVNNYDCYTGQLIDSIKLDTKSHYLIYDISINPQNNELAIGSIGSHNYSGISAYDFYDLSTNKFLDSNLIIWNGHSNDSRIYSQYINDNIFFSIFISPNSKIIYGDEAKIFNLKKVSNFIFYGFADWTSLDNYKSNYIFHNSNVFLLFFRNGDISFYNMDDSLPKSVLYSHLEIADIKVDEETSSLFVFSTNGTVKCFDISNEILITDVREEATESKEIFSLFPNPAQDDILIKFPFFKNSDISINITNEIGTSVVNKTVSIDSQVGSVLIDTRNLPTGTYFCIIRSGNYYETKKYIVLR